MGYIYGGVLGIGMALDMGLHMGDISSSVNRGGVAVRLLL